MAQSNDVTGALRRDPSDMSGVPDLEAPPGCRGILFEPAYKPILFVLILMTVMGAAITTAFYLLGPSFLGSAGNQPGGGPGGPGASASVAPTAIGVPAITERFFDSGTSHISVTGPFSLGGDLALDTIASYVTNQGRATIVFGPPDPNALLVQVTFNEPEDTVTVIQGDRRATGMDTDCVFTVTVSETLIAGHISCPSAEAFNGDASLGTATIELEFSAGSPPGGGIDGDGGEVGPDGNPIGTPND